MPLLFSLIYLLTVPLGFCQEEEQPVQTPNPFIEKGGKLLEDGKTEKALKSYTEGLALFPENTDLMIGAGKAALLGNDAAASLNHLYKAVGAAPESYEANLYLGKAMCRHGQELANDLMSQNEGYMMIEDSLGFLRKASKLDDTAIEPGLELARTLYWLNDLEAADEAVLSAIERSPGNIDALLLRGDISYTAYRYAGGRGEGADEVRIKWQNAMDLYLKAAEIDPENAKSYIGIAALYEADKKWKESAEAYRNALIRNPELINAYNRLITIFRRDDMDGSLPEYIELVLQKLRKRFPGDKARTATALYYLAFAHFTNGDFKSSIDTYNRSASLNPDYLTGASYYIGRARCELGELDQARKMLLKTFERDPEGLAYFMKNDNEFENTVYPSLKGLAFDCYKNGRMNDAREVNALMLSAVVDDSSLYNDYAFLCRETGKYEESYKAYRSAIELSPTNPSLLNDAALILHYHLHRDLGEAKLMYEKAVQEAGIILNGENPNRFDLDEVRVALRDASNNLRLLKAGITRERDG